MKIAILFDHFGPYHLARLRAAAACCEAVGVEFRDRSRDYAWERAARDGVTLVTLTSPGPADASLLSFAPRLEKALGDFHPDAVAVPGWSSPEALGALHWCRRMHIPAVLMSESSEHDERRVWWKELVKRRIVAQFSAALVGGARHVAYLRRLGMPGERIFTGYDVVDNSHFAPRTPQNEGEQRPHFLASARFVEKKNLPALLRSYSAYRKATTAAPWDLVLLGDGPLRPALETIIDELGLSESVTLPGFKQYDELPGYYARASAFVHASVTEQWGLVVNEAIAAGLPVIVSERCGCVPELVPEGVNGFRFDPADPNALTQCLLRISTLRVEARARMGTASLEIAARHGPERFGEGLARAATAALGAPRHSPGGLDRFLMARLSRR